MVFDPATLAAPAGAPVELTYHNHSTYLLHNWVLVNGGEEVAGAVYEAAMAAGFANDFLPEGNPQILANTPLLESGKSITISFQAPTEPGDYTYLCTFPGHYLAGMKGTLTVT
jgi:azurin